LQKGRLICRVRWPARHHVTPAHAQGHEQRAARQRRARAALSGAHAGLGGARVFRPVQPGFQVLHVACHVARWGGTHTPLRRPGPRQAVHGGGAD
jgi:hypothetical protein